MTTGWVYVLTQPASPGFVKVGQTTRDPAARAAELHDTGSPFPYEVAASFAVADVAAAERAAHDALARWRVAPDREWFRLGPGPAVRLVSGALGRTQRPQRRWWRLVRGLVEALGWLWIVAAIIALLVA